MCDQSNVIGLISDVQVAFSRCFRPNPLPPASFPSPQAVTQPQYADADDGTSFDGTETRYFRGTLESCRQACDFWKELGVRDAVHLGHAARHITTH